MVSNSLGNLPKEILSQILSHLGTVDLCQPALVSTLFNSLCERQIYENVSVVKHAYSHIGETNYNRIRGFFTSLQKRPHRLSYIKEISARLELRMDSGLHAACELFEALPRMPHLTDLTLEIVGGVKPHRGNRQLEQAMIWGCTFERGRMTIYKFFRINPPGEELRGFHALRNLRRVKVYFPSNPIGLQTDLMAYSALQHPAIRNLDLKHIINASLAPPNLPGASGAITHLAMKGCQLPLAAYQSILASISALQSFDYRPTRPMGSLPPGGLVKALGHHSDSLRLLSIKVGAEEMLGLDLSTFTRLSHLQISNIAWNEDARAMAVVGPLKSVSLPRIFPPFLEILTLRNFHNCNFNNLVSWMCGEFPSIKVAALPHLKALRLEAEHLGNEWTLMNSPTYSTSASGFHIDETILTLGERYLRELGLMLCVNDSLLFRKDAQNLGPYDESGPQNVILRLAWKCLPLTEGSEDVATYVEADMEPRGAMERLLLFLRGNSLNGYLSWQDL